VAGKKRKISFGPGYEYDSDKTFEENWKAMNLYYAKLGSEAIEMPSEKDEEIDKLFEKMLPQLEKSLSRTP
jgi:hypothetical protein